VLPNMPMTRSFGVRDTLPLGTAALGVGAQVFRRFETCSDTVGLRESLRSITEAGGTVLQPAQDTPFGRAATAGDPTGAACGLTSPHG
jgi:predicted enzyme related to lactoylglutathione lyase